MYRRKGLSQSGLQLRPEHSDGLSRGNGADGEAEYIRRFRERFVDRDCADLLKRKALAGTQMVQELGVTDHCGILIVSAVEILCDYITELKGE